MILAGLSVPVVADQRELSHVHVVGGFSTRPYTFTMQVWYRDIVYDDSAPEDQYTSLPAVSIRQRKQ